jgi:hypothetical protein
MTSETKGALGSMGLKILLDAFSFQESEIYFALGTYWRRTASPVVVLLLLPSTAR